MFRKPQFITGKRGAKMSRYFILKAGGTAWHEGTGMNMSPQNDKLVCVSNEDANTWIGNFAFGIGVYDVHFDKRDCREVTTEEMGIMGIQL